MLNRTEVRNGVDSESDEEYTALPKHCKMVAISYMGWFSLRDFDRSKEWNPLPNPLNRTLQFYRTATSSQNFTTNDKF